MTEYKVKCPKCGSPKVENYGIKNIDPDINELTFSAIMACCLNCGKIYEFPLK